MIIENKKILLIVLFSIISVSLFFWLYGPSKEEKGDITFSKVRFSSFSSHLSFTNADKIIFLVLVVTSLVYTNTRRRTVQTIGGTVKGIEWLINCRKRM